MPSPTPPLTKLEIAIPSPPLPPPPFPPQPQPQNPPPTLPPVSPLPITTVQANLDETVLDTLGIPGVLPIGHAVILFARATVVANAVGANADGPSRSVRLQITDLAVEDAP